MTEEEWLAATNPTPMLEILHEGKASNRKLLLFCLVRCPSYYREGDECKRYVTAFRFVDEDCGLDELRVAWIRDEDPSYPSTFSLPEKPFDWALALTRSRFQLPFVPPVENAPPLIRDIFGNPFRPVSVEPSWLTSTVVALADGIYQERAFDRMPILADALEDEGCDHADILNHCRGDGPHVRGCWVVDLLTGRK